MLNFHARIIYCTYNHFSILCSTSVKTEPKFRLAIRTKGVGSSNYRLYDSIKHIGLVQPLVLVENSDTHNYELFGGGRTRLKLLEAVQLERKTQRLDPVQAGVVYRDKPVPSKEISLSHLIQNHIHRRRKFIDKALHLNDCVETKEKEIARKMSQRKRVSWLRQNGFPISQSLLNDMQFTATVLYPILPQALSGGMGRRHIVSIRKLYRAMREIWKSFGDDLSDCREAFQDICEECDDDTIDIELFREVMEREICLWCGLNSQFVRTLLQVNCEDRARLIEAFDISECKGLPQSRSLPQPSRQKVKNKAIGVPTSKSVPTVIDLPPGVINRRKRFARRLALNLAKHANLLNCVSGSITNPIGYRVLCPSSSSHASTIAIWQFLYSCQHVVQSPYTNNQRLRPGWRTVDRREFLNACSLIEVSRTLCVARRNPKSTAHLQKAA